jgi:hypothetical protein
MFPVAAAIVKKDEPNGEEQHQRANQPQRDPLQPVQVLGPHGQSMDRRSRGIEGDAKPKRRGHLAAQRAQAATNLAASVLLDVAYLKGGRI